LLPPDAMSRVVLVPTIGKRIVIIVTGVVLPISITDFSIFILGDL